MFILRTPAEMHAWSRSVRHDNRSIGFVPTMGALHHGHAELIRQASNGNDEAVVSIFVNPTQFNVQSDFDKYPRTFDEDVRIAQESGATAIYAPTAESMYPHGYRTFVEPGVASDPMEGEGRPGHFRGVATVVVKLLNAVHPHRAYFGRKDFQQLAVVNETVSALDLDVTIIGVPTVREADGLALSSRNVRLSIEARRQSPIIFKALNASRLTFQNGQRDSEALEKIAKDIMAEAPLCRIEYVTVSNANTLIRTETCSEQSVMCVACWFEDVRLIDNIEL